MKRFISQLGFPMLLLLLFAMACRPTASKPETTDLLKSWKKKHGGPGHPGWYDQWFTMKKDETGKIPHEAIRLLAAEINETKSLKAGGNLWDIAEFGPDNIGGRTRAFLIDKINPNKLFAGGISGGLWVSNNLGASWNPVNDDEANLSITYIDQNPLDPSVLYYCSGEVTGNSAGITGNGIHKSTDGGATFFTLPSTQNAAFNTTWRIKCSMVDTNTLYVACGSNNGLLRSTDAGVTWQNLISNRTVTDLEVFPDGSVIIAQHGLGIFKSPDGSPSSFVPINNGLPGSGYNRVVFDYCESAPQIMYCAMENSAGSDITGVYKTTNGGTNWTTVANPSMANIGFYFPWYCLAIEVKPDNPNVVVVGGVDMGISTNGGTSWTRSVYSHADQHIFYFNPQLPNEFYVGNDGGVYRYAVSTHTAATVNLNNGYNVTQYYAGTYFPGIDKVYGGTQDNGTHSGIVPNPSFTMVFGGDGSYTHAHQQFSSIAYVSWQEGHILKTTDAGSLYPTFNYIMNEMDANSDNQIDDGAWFINPYEMNYADGEQLYFVTLGRIWKSINGGDNWEPMTNPITNLYALGVARSFDPIVYMGGQGKFYRMDGALSFLPGGEVNLSASIPNTISTSFISELRIHPQFDSVVYVALSNYSSQPRVWKVTNALSNSPTWTSIGGNLPVNLPVNTIDVSPFDDQFLVAGTDFGVYTSTDGGQTWDMETDIPSVPVFQVKIRHSDGKTFIYTHGRGIWVSKVPNNLSLPPVQSLQDLITVIPMATSGNIQVIAPDGAFDAYQIHDMSGKIISNGKYEGQGQIQYPAVASGMIVVSLYQKGKWVKTAKIFSY